MFVAPQLAHLGYCSDAGRSQVELIRVYLKNTPVTWNRGPLAHVLTQAGGTSSERVSVDVLLHIAVLCIPISQLYLSSL